MTDKQLSEQLRKLKINTKSIAFEIGGSICQKPKNPC